MTAPEAGQGRTKALVLSDRGASSLPHGSTACAHVVEKEKRETDKVQVLWSLLMRTLILSRGPRPHDLVQP